MNITSTELGKCTGATRKQIHYWCKIGIITPKEKRDPHDGIPMEFDYSIIDFVKFLVRMSNALGFGKKDTTVTLKLLSDHYEDGFMCLSDDVILDWRE